MRRKGNGCDPGALFCVGFMGSSSWSWRQGGTVGSSRLAACLCPDAPALCVALPPHCSPRGSHVPVPWSCWKSSAPWHSVWGFPLRLEPCAAVQGSRTFGSRILLYSPLGFLGGNSASLQSKKVEGVFFFLFFQFNVVKMLNIIKSVVIFARNIIYFCFSSAPFSSTTVSGQS